MELITTESGWVLQMADCQIGILEIAYQFGIHLTDKNATATLRIEGPFEIYNEDETIRLDPAFPKTLGPALPLFKADVLDVTIQKTGHLKMRLKDGRSIEAFPDEKYEAWQINSSLNFLMICCPGGEVALFVQPNNETH